MLAFTGQEMRELDRRMIEDIGVPGMVLMENAGRSVVCEIEKLSPKKVLILVGSGNNGGDGLVIARYLLEKDYDVSLWLTTSREKLKGDALSNLVILEKIFPEEKMRYIASPEDIEENLLELELADLVVDGILGTGITGEVRGLKAVLIQKVNSLEKKVLAIDIPSGLNADTGEPAGVCIKADLTVTFAYPKVGICVYPGAEYAGEVIVKDIGMLKEAVKGMDIKQHYLEPDWVKKLLPKRSWDSHKNSVGKVLVTAGSKGMLGAALMSARAALRAGAGLVTLALPESLVLPAMTQLTEVIVKGLPENGDGSLGLWSYRELEKLMKKNDVMVFGPGISHTAETELLTLQIVENSEIPLLIDADGLNCLAANNEFLQKKRNNLILTPHWGEMSRLTGLTSDGIGRTKLDLVRKKSSEWDCTLVLKGARTLIASKNELYINSTGNSGMATAGSGDVLSGIIGGLWSSGISAEDAAVLGVYLHGLAGDLAKGKKSELGLTAGDLIEFLPEAILSLLYFS